MFRRKPQDIESLVRAIIRANGMETPWLQRRVVSLWEEVAGPVVARYTESKEIRNQTLWIRIGNPAVRADLQMRRTQLTAQLNSRVGATVINDIRLF